jgi:type I restriction enzyme S subunit
MILHEWQSTVLGAHLRFQKGVSYKGEYLDKPGLRLLGLGTIVPGGGISLASARQYCGPVKSHQQIQPGEVYVALTDITQDGRVLGSPALLPSNARGGYAVTHHVAKAIIERPNELDMAFLYYLLQSEPARAYFRGVATGTTVRSVSAQDAENLEIQLPPLSEQREIASILGALDDKIELSQRMNTTLEAMARALFQSWFVDFDPVRAKTEGQQPVGMDAETAALFPDSFTDSALGPIPKGWAHINLGSVAHVGSGKRPSTQNSFRSASASVPVYGGAGQTGWTDTALINEPLILTGRVGTLGKILRTEGPVWPSDNTLMIQPKALWINQLYFALQNVDLLSLNRGSSQPMLTQHDIRSQLIIAADLPVSQHFETLVSPLVEFQTMLNVNIERLSSTREVLLPRLLSGDLRVGGEVAA